MPSMVSTSAPSASAPSTRQEQTSRPSSVTLQAPQSPVPQPSLAPVRPRLVAQHIQQGFLGLAQEFCRVAVDRGCDVNLAHDGSSCAFVGDFGGPAGQHAGDMGAEFDGAALVVDGFAAAEAAAASASSAASSTVVPIRAFAASSTSNTVGATAPSATRAAVQMPAGVQRQATRRSRPRRCPFRCAE